VRLACGGIPRQAIPDEVLLEKVKYLAYFGYFTAPRAIKNGHLTLARMTGK
jgi:hypothetical protein